MEPKSSFLAITVSSTGRNRDGDCGRNVGEERLNGQFVWPECLLEREESGQGWLGGEVVNVKCGQLKSSQNWPIIPTKSIAVEAKGEMEHVERGNILS